MKNLYIVCYEWICGTDYLMACKSRKAAEDFISKQPPPEAEDSERYYIEKVPFEDNSLKNK